MVVSSNIKIAEFLEDNIAEEYYYKKQKFYSQLKEQMLNPDTCYQWRRHYLRENKNNLCPTLTANMGTGGHNVPLIVDKYDIRKLTPRECARLQGFPDTFILPSSVAKSILYKQIGNSVSVPVVQSIAQNIIAAMQNRA